MKPGRKLISIPVIQAKSPPDFVIGAKSCSTQEAVSQQELEALAEIRRLRKQADEIKMRLKSLGAGSERDELTRQLTALRQEALLWQDRRKKATAEKHVALGHVDPPEFF